jgi:hypothetical protein
MPGAVHETLQVSSNCRARGRVASDAPCGWARALVKMEACPAVQHDRLFRTEIVPSRRARGTAGGKIHRNKLSIGEHGFIALVLDTEGNMFGLHSMK